MPYKILNLSFLFLFLFLQSVSVNAIDLAREATIQRLTTSLENQDYERAYDLLQGLKQSGVEIKGELLYYESLAALLTKKDFEAFNVAKQYVEQSGRDAKHYANALEIYSVAGENIDRRLAINSIKYFSKSAIELYIENRKTSLFNEFFERKVKEYEAFNASHVDNEDGTISVYRAIPNDAGTIDLYKWDLFACALGQVYKNGVCHGERRVFEQVGKATAKSVVERLSFAGHSDWQIPGAPHGLFLIRPAIQYFEGQDYRGWGSNGVFLPQAYLLNIDTNVIETATRMKAESFDRNVSSYDISYLPFIFQAGEMMDYQYCKYVGVLDRYCDDRSYSVIPSRGPELVGSNLEPQCSDEFFSPYDTAGRLRPGEFVCLSYNGANRWFMIGKLEYSVRMERYER